MSRVRVLSAADAAALIPDEAIVTVSSSSGLGCPDAVLAAIGERFAASSHPRNLTTIHPIAAGDMYGIKGIDHIAQEGLLAKVLAGSYPSGPSSMPSPAIWEMITHDRIPAYNVPSGILFDLTREAAAKRPGVLTKVGLEHLRRPEAPGLRHERQGRGGADRPQDRVRRRRLAVLPDHHAQRRHHPRHHGRRARQPHLRARGRLSRPARPGAGGPQQWRDGHRPGEAAGQGRHAEAVRGARPGRAGRRDRGRTRPDADHADRVRPRDQRRVRARRGQLPAARLGASTR